MLADRYRRQAAERAQRRRGARDGAVWFTDPHYGGNTDYEGGKHASELPPTVYRLDPAARCAVVADDFAGPNGLCFSPDETRLYVAETGRAVRRRPDAAHPRVRPCRRPAAGGPGVPRRLAGLRRRDALRQDGRVWTSAGDGVHCIDPDGTLLGKVLTGDTVANLTFGGRNRSRLFICASHRLMALYTNVRGAQVP